MTDTRIADQPLPGMPDLPPLWAVHVQGADDIHAMPSKRDADLYKLLLDGLDKANAHRENVPAIR
jgi:hypothetical protein